MNTEDNVRITHDIDFGNLTGLIGTWHGEGGFNMIAVPDQKGDFKLLVRPYTETLIVNKVHATTPNRGLNHIANLPTLQYSTTILDAETLNLMHVENGFWELIDSVGNLGFDIFRLASIPHGDSVAAMGVSSVNEGPPVIDTKLSGVPLGDIINPAGYSDIYGFPLAFSAFSPEKPNKTLIDQLIIEESFGWKVTKTVELKVSTLNRGGINNIPSLDTNANATQFDATFWLETLVDGENNVKHQLQYSQRILIQFPIKDNLSGQTIVWPHINVNTLTLKP